MPDKSHPLDRAFLQDMAKVLTSKLPDNYGFIILAAPFNNPDGSPSGDNRTVYTSNIQRPDAIALIKEWLIKCGASEDWMKHIK